MPDAPLGHRHAEARRLRALLRDPRARASERAFVVEGPRGVDAALARGARLETLYLGPEAERSFATLVERAVGAGVTTRTLKEGVLEKLGSTVTPQPILAVARMPEPWDRAALTRHGLAVVGVALADPGNVGTLVRSAEASGAAAIVLSTGSVDAYNPKVVRASAGAIFGIPVFEGWSVVEALDVMREVGRQRLAADTRGGTPYDAVDFRTPTAVVLGHEAHGIPPEASERVDGRVTVPMQGAAESLNVAMAGTVLCFESARQRAGRGRAVRE